MSDFENLSRNGGSYYRGSYGQEANAIMSMAVGPIRSVAKYFRDNDLDVCDAVRTKVVRLFNKAIIQPNGPLIVQGAPQGEIHVSAPGHSFADQLDTLLKRPQSSQNLFTIFEHVLYEPEAQLNSHRTSRLLESISYNPKVAILYAYGISPDAWFESNQVDFWCGRPNQNAFIAVLPSSVEIIDSNKQLAMLCNIAGPSTMTKGEAERRMQRDSEELLSKAFAPCSIIDLPVFDTTDPIASLDAAADELCNRGVAS